MGFRSLKTTQLEELRDAKRGHRNSDACSPDWADKATHNAGPCSALAATKCATPPAASPVISAACYPWKVLCRRLFVPADPLVSAIAISCSLVCHSGRFLFIVFCLYPERKCCLVNSE